MIITGVETFPLRIPFRPGTMSAASAWDPEGLPAVESLLVKVTVMLHSFGRGSPVPHPARSSRPSHWCRSSFLSR